MKNKTFTYLDYNARQEAMVLIAEVLQERKAWTVYDFGVVSSPARLQWSGIASTEQIVLVVDNPSNTKSEEKLSSPLLAGAVCRTCNGTGIDNDPEAWTLELASQSPMAFNTYYMLMKYPQSEVIEMKDRPTLLRGDGITVKISGEEVNPTLFVGGRLRCIACAGDGGDGKTLKQILDFPAYQPNPVRQVWHIEAQGKILDSGMTLNRFSYMYYHAPTYQQRCELARVEIRAWLDRLQAGTQTSTVASRGIEIVQYTERAIAVRGDTKPLKDTLKVLGGKFNARLKDPVTGQKFSGWIFSKKKEEQLKLLVNGK